MTRREMLTERYEEALFALLLDEVAEAEGRKIVEEQAQLQPLITPEARERCRKVIAHQTRQQETKRVTMRAGRIVAKVAVIALVMVLMLATAFATNEQFRINTLNLIIETFEDRTKFSVTDFIYAGEKEEPTPPTMEINWVPEGFTLQDEGSSGVSAWQQFENESGALLSCLVIDLTTGGMSFDTETAPMQSIELNGEEAYLIDEGTSAQVIWQWSEDPSWLVYVATIDMDADTALKVAENMVVTKAE